MAKDSVTDAHETWMGVAIAEAQAAALADEVPIGCVIVRNGQLIGRGRNEREATPDPTAHAEILALRRAALATGDWRLDQCTMYVTLEPCAMCAGAIVLARLGLVVFGTTDPKAGACGTLYRLTEDHRLNHQTPVLAGVRQSECAALLTSFFQHQRAKGKK